MFLKLRPRKVGADCEGPRIQGKDFHGSLMNPSSWCLRGVSVIRCRFVRRSGPAGRESEGDQLEVTPVCPCRGVCSIEGHFGE